MTKQLFNGNQQSGALSLGFLRKVKSEGFKWAFCILYVCLQGVRLASPIETRPTIPSNIRSESKDGGEVSVVILKDDYGRGLAAGVKPHKGVVEGGAKLSAGKGEPSFVAVAPSEVSAQTTKEHPDEKGFDHMFMWLVAGKTVMRYYIEDAMKRLLLACRAGYFVDGELQNIDGHNGSVGMPNSI